MAFRVLNKIRRPIRLGQLWLFAAICAFSCSVDTVRKRTQAMPPQDRELPSAKDPKKAGLTFALRTDDKGRFTLLFDTPPRWLHTLTMRSTSLEPELKAGDWLVLEVAVWSSTDLGCIKKAVAGMTTHAPAVQLGIRPFEKYDEIEEVRSRRLPRGPTPVWLFVANGVVVHCECGDRSVKEVETMVANHKRTNGSQVGGRSK